MKSLVNLVVFVYFVLQTCIMMLYVFSLSLSRTILFKRLFVRLYPHFYNASVMHFQQSTKMWVSIVERDTELTILCYVKQAQCIVLFTYCKAKFRFRPKGNGTNARKCLLMFKTNLQIDKSALKITLTVILNQCKQKHHTSLVYLTKTWTLFLAY